MKKVKWTVLLSAILVFGIIAGAAGAETISEIRAQLRRDFKVVVDGEAKEFKNVNGEAVYPVLYEGTTYLPVRAIGELMGKTVYWYEDDKRIELRAKVEPTVTDADVIILEENKKANKKDDKNAFIDAGEAKAIALEKAGFKAEDVKFKKAKLDEDDGLWHYEVEFKTGGVKHEFEIGAVNGAVLDWEIDRKNDNRNDHKEDKSPTGMITEAKAKELALEKAGLKAEEVVFEKVELDEDDGVWVYEVEFEKGEDEYEAEIDASTGEIVEWETDLDD